MIQRLVLGELETNTYIYADNVTCYIIDPADSPEHIGETLLQNKVTPTAILLTHGHFDHCLAAGALQQMFSIPCYLNPLDVFLIQRLESTAQKFLESFDPIILPITEQYPTNLDSLSLLHTPGHTPGSVSLVSAEGVFVGDVVFKNGIGRYDHSYCSKSDLQKSIRLLQKEVSPTLSVYSGHGESTTMGEERDFLTSFLGEA